MKEVLEVLKARKEGKGFACELTAEMGGRTFNSVNATLAALATKGLVSKEKKMYGEGAGAKILTEYTITERGLAELEPAEAEETADAE